MIKSKFIPLHVGAYLNVFLGGLATCWRLQPPRAGNGAKWRKTRASHRDGMRPHRLFPDFPRSTTTASDLPWKEYNGVPRSWIHLHIDTATPGLEATIPPPPPAAEARKAWYIRPQFFDGLIACSNFSYDRKITCERTLSL